MDIEWLARKLQPLMPDRIARWQRARASADPQLKSLIDAQIVAEGFKRFGDPTHRILLSLPPAPTIQGTLNLGTVLYEKEKWPAGLRESEFLQNLGIFGRSGSGKTNIVLHLLLQLEAKGIPWLFLDWKRTARHLIPLLSKPVGIYTPGRALSPFVFNPFEAPEGLEPQVYINHAIDTLADAYTLGEGARRMLQKAIMASIPQGANSHPSLHQILQALESLPEKDRSRGWKQSALRALESLSFAHAVADQPRQADQTKRLLRRNTIIELDGLPQAAREFLVPLLLLWIFQERLGQPRREKLDLVIIVEEAHHVLYRQERRARESLVNTILRQSRELGVAFVIVDQHPGLMSRAALGNCFTTICLNLKDPSDVQCAAHLSLLADHEKRFFGMLPVGEGIVKLQDSWTKPFLVKIPLIRHDKGAMTDQRLKHYLENQKADSPGHLPVQPVWEQIPRVPLADGLLNQDLLAFLHDVFQYPWDGVRARYRRMELSGRQGTRLQHYLLQHGWLDGQVVPQGHTRTLMLRLTAEARRMLRLSDGNAHNIQTRESIAHAFWKQHYAQWLQGEGYRVRMEAAREKPTDGYMDVWGEKDGYSIAVEIETGQSDVVHNIRRALRSGIRTVLVVVTDVRKRKQIEQQLAHAGLLLPTRVHILNAGEHPRLVSTERNP